MEGALDKKSIVVIISSMQIINTSNINRLILTLFIFFPGVVAVACPEIGGLIDYNCDQEIKIAIAGDSVVKGIGDLTNGNEGGYALRLEEQLNNSTVGNVGVAGVTSRKLLRLFRRNLRKSPEGATQLRTFDTDLILIDVGRNDYWDKKPVRTTVRNIKRLVKLLREKVAENSNSEAFVVVSTLIPTNRSYQQPFITDLNRELRRKRSEKLPVYFRFDRVRRNKILSSDGLHPDSSGYDVLARKLARFLNTRAQKLMGRQRSDTDGDGLYDYFEENLFLTNPGLEDTDSDSLSDGEEVITYLTNPLKSDSDDDGVGDELELGAGTNPNDSSDY